MTPKIAASAAERNLEDVIFQLQRLILDPPVRRVVDEAAQLFAEGRHMEAGALVEKAEAMRVAGAKKGLSRNPERNPEKTNTAAAQGADSGPVARLVGNLANGLAGILVNAIHDLEQHIAAETRALGDSFSQQLDRLQVTVGDLLQLKERIEKLTEMVADQKSVGLATQKNFEQLLATTQSLQQAGGRQEAELGNIRREVQQVSSSFSDRIDTVCARVGVQEEEVSGLKSTVSGVSPRVNALVERLDRQADAIRSIYESEAVRENALDQLVDVLSKLKALNFSIPPKPDVPL